MKTSKAERKAIRRAYKAASYYDDQMTCLCEDPMTEAMGAPVGDFSEGYARTHRKLVAEALRDPLLERFASVREMLFGALERYMP